MADFQLTRQRDLLSRLLRAVDAVQQKARCSRTQLITGLVYRSKRRRRELGKIEVVKADDGYVFRTMKPQLTGRVQHAHCHQIVARKDRSRPRQHRSEE